MDLFKSKEDLGVWKKRIIELELDMDGLKKRLNNLDFDFQESKRKKRIPKEEEEKEVVQKGYILQ